MSSDVLDAGVTNAMYHMSGVGCSKVVRFYGGYWRRSIVCGEPIVCVVWSERVTRGKVETTSEVSGTVVAQLFFSTVFGKLST